MASARDIIPIVLAGLGGALGGRQTAGAITNAAQISRAGRLDKQRWDRLDESNARSARSLELSEEAAGRAKEGLELAQSRESRYAADQEKRDKKTREAEAHLKKGKAEWLEGHPDATEEQLWQLQFMDTPNDVIRFDQHWAEINQRPTLEEAKLTTRDLEAGQRVSIRTKEGATLSVTGQNAEGQGIPPYQIQTRFDDGEREFRKEMNRRKVEVSKEQDAINRMMNDEDVGNDKEASERNKQLMDAREELEYDVAQGPWSYIRRELGSLGFSQQHMADMEAGYYQALQERNERREQETNSARELSPSEIDIKERAKTGRRDADMPVAEEAIAEEEGVPGRGLTPFGETVVGGAERGWEGWKNIINTARESYGMKQRRSHE